MRVAMICGALTLLAGTGSAEANSRDIPTTWAKPGVSFTEYRQDANLCAKGAMEIDISVTDAAKQAVKASKAIDNAYDAAFGMGSSIASWAFPGGEVGGVSYSAIANIETIRRAYRPELIMAEVKDWQLQVLHGCLRGLGYTPVALTDEQRARLKRLPLRSQRRAHYLHSIASSPAALRQTG